MLFVLLAQLFLLFFLCQMMADDAAGCSADYSVVSGHVSGDGPNCGALDAAFGFRNVRCGQENETREVHRQYPRRDPLPPHLIALPAEPSSIMPDSSLRATGPPNLCDVPFGRQDGCRCPLSRRLLRLRPRSWY
jgi:hypothetical protein